MVYADKRTPTAGAHNGWRLLWQRDTGLLSVRENSWRVDNWCTEAQGRYIYRAIADSSF